MDHIRAPWRLIWGGVGRTVRAPQIIDADSKPVVAFGNQARHQELTKILARANLIAATPDLLNACEAEEAFWEHYDTCHECSRTAFCQDALWLMVKARGLRLRALAKAEPKGEK